MSDQLAQHDDERLSELLTLQRESQITAITPIGRATVIALQLNNLLAITVRANWIAAGWHPPKKEKTK